jgi:hypothetical protein
MTTTGYRIVYTLLALALIAIIGGSILFIPSGDPERLPDAVESYAPGRGDLVTQPVRIVIDLLPNYRASFVIDGITIPDDEVDSIVEVGRYQFEAGPGKVIDRWATGDHTVVVSYVGGPNDLDAGTIVWTFRIQ